MAKNKNKGFTLIEIMIAIAILSILLVPIMKQFAQTLDTSRRAKELQYLNENAGYILEFSQREDLAKIATAEGSDAAEEADDIKLKSTPAVDIIACQVYNDDGTEVSGVSVEYNATRYELNDAELGIKNNVYERTVITDDLSVKLASEGYKIRYGLTDADLAKFPENSGFELTNEGSIVKYNDKGYVNSVACYSADAVDNPNEANLGNMQDLDATKVAIIPGTTMNFDPQAKEHLFAIAMDKLKRENPEEWKAAMRHDSGDNPYNKINFSSKLTKIYIDKNDGIEDDKDDDYYIVKADVYYEYSGQIVSYNVYSQKFYTERCPDIYFEYQPPDNDSSDGVEYEADDDIMIDNYVVNPDSDDDGIEPDLVKLYLYKPTHDQKNHSTKADMEKPVDSIPENDHVYYSGTGKVRINVYRANGNGYPVNIYTNLYKTELGVKRIDPEQFKVNVRLNAEGKPIIESVKTDSPREADKNDTSRRNYSYNNIKLLEEDKRTSDRLLTVTVRLEPTGDNNIVSEIKLTGAKGEN